MKKMAIIGGRILDPMNQLDKVSNLYIEQGRIIAIDTKAPANFLPDQTLDASHCLVCPGFVDLASHLGTCHDLKIDQFNSNLEKAVVAGITHLATNAFTYNRCFEPGEIELLSLRASQAQKAKVFFIGSLTLQEGTRLNELSLLKKAGCIGFTNGYRPIANNLIKRRCYDYAAMLGLKAYLFPEDPDLSLGGSMHEGEQSMRLGLTGIPSISESIAISTELQLIEQTGLSAHFCRLSAAKSIELLREAKAEKLPVTADVAIHQLFLTDESVQLENGLYRVRPPFRTRLDLLALRKAISNGSVDAIVSDHIALGQEDKSVPFQEALPGIASWPVFFPLTARLATEEKIDLLEAISLITSKPAQILGIDAGHLTLNSQADITIIQPDYDWRLSSTDLDLYGSNNPFATDALRGRVKYTVVNGRIVYTAK
jgi:dihydroorotase